tara:strand:+ start:147 stop:572 length:426 start_codon:yes stop_codon:yes gene_type:complete
MDVDKIFGLFNNEEPDSLLEKAKMTEVLMNYKDHPLFWVGMFKKLISNHKTFNKEVVSFFSKLEDEELDMYDVEQAGEFITYNRAWFWISKLDTSDRICQDALLYYTDEYLKTYLKFSMSYWEETEEYEKCAHLKKIIDFL